MARDNAGRIFQERRLLVPNDGKHESLVTQIEISDPVSHQLYICVPRQRVCQLEWFSAFEFTHHSTSVSSNREPGSPTLENLGKLSIEGMETEGTRETGVVEAGAIGNDSPILTSREFWYSPQLGINLISKVQDPRLGSQKFEVSELVLGAPDTKLFKIPANSKVIDLREHTRPSSPAQNPVAK